MTKRLTDSIRALIFGTIIGLGVSYFISPIIENKIYPHNYRSITEDSIQSVLYPKKSKKNSLDFNKLNYEEAIKKVETPGEVQWTFLEDYFNFYYDKKEMSGMSFKEDYTKKKGVCLDYAVCAAALLSDDGYPPLILIMRSQKETKDHGVFLFKDKETGWFGALGNTPLFSEARSVNDLVKAFYSEQKIFFDEYTIINLDNKFRYKEWINGNVDLQNMMIDKWTKVN